MSTESHQTANKDEINKNDGIDSNIKKTNIIAMSMVSFFMNFASGMIVSSCNNFLIGQLQCSPAFLGIVRGGSEALGNLVKVIFGMLSDRMKNRKLFLMIGYGGMFLLKPIFGLSALNIFARSTKLFLYGFNHAVDRMLNAMRDGVRDASIYESSGKKTVGSSMGIRKFMACFGSFIGGIASFLVIRKFTNIPQSKVFSVMYFSTIIPVSIAMFILFFFVTDVFKEKYKNVTVVPEEESIPVSNNILPGNMIITSLLALGLGTLIGMFVNLRLGTNILYPKVLSIILISFLVFEIFVVKIYPEFFSRLSKRRLIFQIINFFLFADFGVLMMNGWTAVAKSLAANNITGLFKIAYVTFFEYGLNGTIIIPLVIFFRLVFYALYKKMQPTLEYYQDRLKKYDKIITLTFILSFGKYSDIFVFKHVIETCGWDMKYTPLLYSALYILFGIFAYVLGKMSDGVLTKHSMYYLVAVNIGFNIMTSAIKFLPPALQGVASILSLTFYAAYVGLIDSVLVSIVSKAIPVDRLLATLLGLFYLLIGVGNACASYLIGTIFTSTQQAYEVAIIPAVLGIIFTIYNRKILQSQLEE